MTMQNFPACLGGGGIEGDRRGPSDPGIDQVPRARGPRPPPPFPRFDQRLHRALDDAHDRGVRRIPAGSGDDRWPRGDGTRHGADPFRRRSDPGEGLDPTAISMASENDFPSNIGLGASASGFAALAMASAKAAGLDLGLEEISRFARRGAGSAARAVTGGFSKWKIGLTDEDSYATRLAG